MAPLTDHPFAPPGEAPNLGVLFAAPPGVDGPWRDADGRVVAREGTSWPEQCARCGSTAHLATVPHGYKKPSHWGPVLVPLTWGAYFLVHLASKPDVVLHPQLCPWHRQEARIATLGRGLGLGMWVVLALVAWVQVGSIVGAAALGMTATLWGLWMPSTPLRATRIDGRIAYLAGADHTFLSSLPPASSEDVLLLFATVPDADP